MKPYEKKLLKSIGTRIRTLREKQGISQDQLAYECEKHRVQINRIENGLANPTLLTLAAIAKVLNVSVKELVGEG